MEPTIFKSRFKFKTRLKFFKFGLSSFIFESKRLVSVLTNSKIVVDLIQYCKSEKPRAAVVNMKYRAGSTFPVPVCTAPNSMYRTSRCNKVDAVRLYASYRLNLLLLKGQRCVKHIFFYKFCQINNQHLL